MTESPRYLPAEPDRVAQRSDRLLWISIVGAFVVGVALLGLGAWQLLSPPEFTKTWVKGVLIGFFIGPILIGIGVGELRHRLRRGAQEPGRHSRKR